MVRAIRQLDIKPITNRPRQDKELFFPHWNCFCCCDTGTVTPFNATKVCKEYRLSTHPAIACVRPGCGAISPRHAQRLLEPDDCEALHLDYRQDWEDTVKARQENPGEHQQQVEQIKTALRSA